MTHKYMAQLSTEQDSNFPVSEEKTRFPRGSPEKGEAGQNTALPESS